MKKSKRQTVSITSCLMGLLFIAALPVAAQTNPPVAGSEITKAIYLYGEKHGVEKILKKELQLWGYYYTNQGFRHLFVELPYYTAEFLNIWMHSQSDEILDSIYKDWIHTASQNPVVRDFYKEIKTRFPETVFHGTDIGHQYQTIGKRYLEYLMQQNLKNSEKYQQAQEVIEQGKYYYAHQKDGVYRENKMVVNFVREYNQLNNVSIMGIYGSAHTDINSLDHSNSVASMANQLNKLYANQLVTENLSGYAKDIDPLRTDSFQINGSYYKALYFGRGNLNGFKGYAYRDFWRLEGAFTDFKEAKKTGDVLPYNNFPMIIETGQVFVIEYMKTDSTLIRKYFRSDGNIWNNLPATEEFKAK